MSNSTAWEFVSATPEGQPFRIGGLDVWEHGWKDTGERAQVKDPLYHQDFTFHVYEISSRGRVVSFAAGEFSACMWGFYVRR
jgi:hypothetical protein